MKDIENILKDAGIESSKAESIIAEVNKNYRTVMDYEKQVKKEERATVERDTWKERAETAEETLKKFDGKDVDAMQKEIDDWKKKAEDAEKNFNAKEAEREKQELLKEAFADIEFTSNAAKNAIMAQISENVSVKNGKLIGFNDLLEDAKKNDASAFVTKEGAQRITSGTVNNNNSSGGVLTKKDIDGIKDSRERQRAIAESLARKDGIYQKE